MVNGFRYGAHAHGLHSDGHTHSGVPGFRAKDRSVDYMNVDSRLIAWANEISRLTGRPTIGTDGKRSAERQMQYASLGYGARGGAGAAHPSGRALDIRTTSLGTVYQAARNIGLRPGSYKALNHHGTAMHTHLELTDGFQTAYKDKLAREGMLAQAQQPGAGSQQTAGLQIPHGQMGSASNPIQVSQMLPAPGSTAQGRPPGGRMDTAAYSAYLNRPVYAPAA